MENHLATGRMWWAREPLSRFDEEKRYTSRIGKIAAVSTVSSEDWHQSLGPKGCNRGSERQVWGLWPCGASIPEHWRSWHSPSSLPATDYEEGGHANFFISVLLSLGRGSLSKSSDFPFWLGQKREKMALAEAAIVLRRVEVWQKPRRVTFLYRSPLRRGENRDCFQDTG